MAKRSRRLSSGSGSTQPQTPGSNSDNPVSQWQLNYVVRQQAMEDLLKTVAEIKERLEAITVKIGSIRYSS